MTAMPSAGPELTWADIWPIWFLSLLLIIPLSFVWLMSPLGFGFARWPGEPYGMTLRYVYAASYFVALPSMLFSWLLSPILFSRGMKKLAIRLPLISLALFLLLATPIWVFVG